MQEIWKDVKGYEGSYQVSNFGEVKSIERIVNHSRNRKRKIKERILIPQIDKAGYLHVVLCNNGINKLFKIHQLVAIVFKGHKPNKFKLVVNHINLNRLDNRYNNLEIITNRENSNKKHIKHSSIYTGVTFNKKINKWQAQMTINKKTIYLGSFINEYDAHLAYQRKLIEINNGQ